MRQCHRVFHDALKGELCRRFYAKQDRKKLWSPCYFAGSCGGAPIAIIRHYIEQQQTPH
ncbi:MAG: transposase [Gallionella sp.]